MIIGCPTEIKPQEFRVGVTPNAAQEAVNHGHDVLIQTGAGVGAGRAVRNLWPVLARRADDLGRGHGVSCQLAGARSLQQCYPHSL